MLHFRHTWRTRMDNVYLHRLSNSLELTVTGLSLDEFLHSTNPIPTHHHRTASLVRYHHRFRFCHQCLRGHRNSLFVTLLNGGANVGSVPNAGGRSGRLHPHPPAWPEGEFPALPRHRWLPKVIRSSPPSFTPDSWSGPQHLRARMRGCLHEGGEKSVPSA